MRHKADFTFDFTQIRQKAGLLCITDLWKQDGSRPNRAPGKWLRSTRVCKEELFPQLELIALGKVIVNINGYEAHGLAEDLMMDETYELMVTLYDDIFESKIYEPAEMPAMVAEFKRAVNKLLKSIGLVGSSNQGTYLWFPLSFWYAQYLDKRYSMIMYNQQTNLVLSAKGESQPMIEGNVNV